MTEYTLETSGRVGYSLTREYPIIGGRQVAWQAFGMRWIADLVQEWIDTMLVIAGRERSLGALVFTMATISVWVDATIHSVQGAEGPVANAYRVAGRGQLTLAFNACEWLSGWSLTNGGRQISESLSLQTIDGPLEFERSGNELHLRVGGQLATGESLLSLSNVRGESVALGGLVLSSRFGGWTLSATGEALRGRPIFELVPETIVVEAVSDRRLELRADLTLSEAMIRELGIGTEPSPQPLGTLTLALPVTIKPAGGLPAALPEESSGDSAAAGAVGPDVVVSTVASVVSEQGMVGDIAAYALDTTSCNRGDEVAIWIDCLAGPNCNQHPVISQNLYRLRTVDGATQFEQIGMAWLKHGFCAADSVLCSNNCQNAGTCDFFGVNCSDTYGSFLNARQQGMGPRSEVNAFTGVYPYPYVKAWQQTGDAIYKRLQVHNDDLDPALNPGAKYFAESQYITTDEEPAARLNNASWRQVEVGSFIAGTGWNLSSTGSTKESEAAIEAWPQFDVDVTLVDAFVPSEGRFILGYKVTALGGEMWHYEYSLYNMNSDRSAQSFSVPIPDGVGVTNIAFHDVDYHSGEDYSGTDWPGVLSGNSVTWATETFVMNGNANALRWDTTYSFRFDCDSPPTAVDVTVELFKTGTPTSLTIPAIGPEDAPPGCDCIADPGCNDGSICTAGHCIDCICSQTDVIYGDVDHDGDVDLFDLFCMLNGFENMFEDCDFKVLDIEPCDGDGDIDIFDLFAVLNAFSGTDPCCSKP